MNAAEQRIRPEPRRERLKALLGELALKERPTPVSIGQRALWFVQALQPQSVAYNINFTARLSGTASMERLRTALDGVLSRHDAFATLFSPGEKGPVARVVPSQRVGIAWRDGSRLTPQARLDLLIDLAATPFDLASGPPVRVMVLAEGQGSAILSVTVHHITGDLWSLYVVARDLAFLLQERGKDLPPAGSWGGHVRAEESYLASNEGQAALSRWRDRLSGIAPYLDLPGDRSASVAPGFRGARLPLILPPDATEGVRAIAAHVGAGTFSVLLSGFAILLSRLADQDSFAVGVPFANREGASERDLVGYCANMLPIPFRMEPDLSVAGLVQRTEEMVRAAFVDQRLPFSRIVDIIPGARSGARMPLFQTSFALQRAHIPNFSGLVGAAAVERTFQLGPMRVEQITLPVRGAAFDLTMMLEELGDVFAGFIEYDIDRFDTATIEAWLRSYVTIVRGMATAPERHVQRIEAVDPRDWPIVLSHGPLRHIPTGSVSKLVDQAAADSTRPAVVDKGGEVSRADFLEMTSRIVSGLERAGIRKGDRVALALDRNATAVAAMVACLRRGAAFVPMDPAGPAARAGRMLAKARANLLISDGPKPSFACDVLHASLGELLQHAADAAKPMVILPDDTAYVLFTSGSTGEPKGVEVTHRGLANVLVNFAEEVGTAARRTLAISPFTFDISLLEVFLPLITGGTVLLAPDTDRADSRKVVEYINLWAPTLIQMTPTGARLAIASGWNGDPDVTVLVGGEALDAELARQLRDRAARVINVYGPTETSIWSTSYEFRDANDEPSIGRPVANTIIAAADKACRLAPPGARARLWIGGAGVARGYCGEQELTETRFRPLDDLDDLGCFYDTGDRVRVRADGTLMFLGRADEQLKLRGFRIEPGEVEAALRRLPGVSDAACVVLGPAAAPRLAAAVVAAEQVDTSIRKRLGDDLPHYMLPDIIAVRYTLPMNANGKLDRARLAAELQASTTDPLEAHEADEEIGVQLSLTVGILSRILGRPIGPDDDFFAAGGHSLLALAAVQQAAAALGRPIELAYFMLQPTARALARAQSSWSDTVVPLGGSADAPILALIPGAGGTLRSFRPLARALADHWRVVGFARLQSPESIDSAAARVGEALRDQDDVTLVGHSIGGLVALAVARSRPRTRAILLDTLPPSAIAAWVSAPPASPGELTLLQDMANGLGLSLPQLLSRAVDGLGTTLGMLPPSIRPLASDARDLVAAALAYRLQADTPPFALIRAREGAFLRSASDCWTRELRSPSVVLDVAGNHISMLAREHASALAERIIAAAHQLRARTSRSCVA
jgi:amino acid adenylation domain-containing protein